MDIRETIRKNLKYYLERSPYTQAEIARALGVSKMSVTKWMKGDNSPNIELLEPLCKLLNINITDVFEEHPEPAETLTTDEHQLVTDYRSFSGRAVGKESFSISPIVAFAVTFIIAFVKIVIGIGCT